MGRGQRWNPAKLKAVRESFGLSPEAFAARIGRVSARTIRHWEAGENAPYIKHLEAIADAFNVDLGVFFEPKNPSQPDRLRRSRRRTGANQMELLPSSQQGRRPRRS